MSTQPIQQPNRAMSPTNVPGPRAASAAAQNAPNGLMQSVGQVAYQQQQPTILQSSASSSQYEDRGQIGNGQTGSPPVGTGERAMSPIGEGRAVDPAKGAAKKGAPPMRPRRDDDATYGVNGGDPSRSKSPTDGRPQPGPRSGSAGPPQNSPTLGNFGPSSATSRVMSPTNGGGPLSNIAERDPTSPPGTYNSPQSVSSGTVQQQPRSNVPANLRNTAAYGRSPSPVVQGNDQPLHSSGGSASSSAPPDAFYNPRSPSLGGVSSAMGGHNRQGSLSGMAGAELMREVRAKDAEIESSRRRERWLKLEIGRAMKAGFLVDEVGAEVSKDELAGSLTNGAESSGKVQTLVDGLMRLKKDKAKMEVSPRYADLSPRLL